MWISLRTYYQCFAVYIHNDSINKENMLLTSMLEFIFPFGCVPSLEVAQPIWGASNSRVEYHASMYGCLQFSMRNVLVSIFYMTKISFSMNLHHLCAHLHAAWVSVWSCTWMLSPDSQSKGGCQLDVVTLFLQREWAEKHCIEYVPI